MVGDLTGRKIKATALTYFGNHISLGRKDGIFQLVDDAAHSKSGALCGRSAARVKAAIVATSAWAISRPTFGKLDHKYRLAARDVSPEVVPA
ncbi:hypothetical protein [Nocardia crassostreae]|uniref:hypothetical protein n=1 Tax=Nocardia crassostreae TaxID=53428 RepID=UPI001FDF5C26|nr:hypothetical protein [Nocardia crassostreae]